MFAVDANQVQQYHGIANKDNEPDNGRKSAITSKVSANFPNAVKNADFVRKVTQTLQEYGYNGDNTLLATSFCCHKVNRPLEKIFANHYQDNYSMGGLTGFPFGGIQSFKEMAQHIPNEGSCLIVYGPHVGIDKDGNVSSVNPRGRGMLGACCESAIAALKQNGKIRAGTAESIIDPLDFQQSMVSKMLLPYAERLDKSTESLIELPHCLYEAQKKMMRQIINAGFEELSDIEGNFGKIAILGGIQINTQESDLDFFLPLDFEIRDRTNTRIANLIDSTFSL